MVGPASISEITDLELDFLVSQRSSLVHVLSGHLSFQSLLGLQLGLNLLILKISLNLRVEIALESKFPSTFSGRHFIKEIILFWVVCERFDPFQRRLRLASW